MTQIPRVTLGLTVAGLLAASVALASPQAQQSSQSPTPTQSQPPAAQQPASTQPAPTAQSGQDPSQTQPQTQAPAQPAPPPPAQTQAPQDQPVAQQDTVHPKNSKEDVDAIGNRNVGKGPNFYSLEREIALGKQLAQEVERSSKLIDDPVVTEYVNRVGQNLVRNSDAKVPFTIKVIDSDEVNAFALPGGFFYVNSGLILRAEEESELAGVMAHEISHVCARHGTKNATKGEAMQLATIPLIFVGGGIGYGIYEAAGLGLPLTFMKFQRNFEAEADYLGLQYMYKTGYDPQAFITFFEKIQAREKKKPGTLAKAFASHPQTPDRIAASQKEIATILPAKAQYIVTTSEFDDVKARLAMIENRHKVMEEKDGTKPSLRRTSTGDKTGNGTDNSGDDDRPTLKRRDDSGDQTQQPTQQQ